MERTTKEQAEELKRIALKSGVRIELPARAPRMQNIPIRTELGRSIRRLVCPRMQLDNFPWAEIEERALRNAEDRELFIAIFGRLEDR